MAGATTNSVQDEHGSAAGRNRTGTFGEVVAGYGTWGSGISPSQIPNAGTAVSRVEPRVMRSSNSARLIRTRLPMRYAGSAPRSIQFRTVLGVQLQRCRHLVDGQGIVRHRVASRARARREELAEARESRLLLLDQGDSVSVLSVRV
jgi:hypothetical protein